MATRKATSAKKPAAKSAASRAKKPTTKSKTVVRTVSSAAPSRKQATPARSTVRPADARIARGGLLDRMTSANLLAALVAEFIGTFLLTAVALHPQFGPAPVIMRFALTAIVLVFGSISGASVNPALAIAGWATRRMTFLRTFGYVAMQVLGAVLALVVMNAFVSQQPQAQPTMFGQSSQIELVKALELPQGKEGLVLAAEMLGTFIFALGVAAATRSRAGAYARAASVGGGLMLGAIVGGLLASLVQGSAVLNPAIAVAQQVFAVKDFAAAVWPFAIYALGASIAAVVAFALYDLLARSVRVVRD